MAFLHWLFIVTFISMTNDSAGLTCLFRYVCMHYVPYGSIAGLCHRVIRKHEAVEAFTEGRSTDTKQFITCTHA